MTCTELMQGRMDYQQAVAHQRHMRLALKVRRPNNACSPSTLPASSCLLQTASCSGRRSVSWISHAPGCHHKQRHLVIQRAAPSSWALFAAISQAAAGKAGGTASASALTAASANLPALLTSIGILIISTAGAVFLICAIPTLWALARLAASATAVLKQVEQELPETAALLRLSGMEVTDCVNELSSLGSDLSGGVRSTAKLVTMTETGVKQAVAVAGQQLVPALVAGESHARGAVEAGLQERAKLGYTLPLISQVANSTTRAVRGMRAGLALANAANATLQLGRTARSKSLPPQQKQASGSHPVQGSGVKQAASKSASSSQTKHGPSKGAAAPQSPPRPGESQQQEADQPAEIPHMKPA